MKLRQMNQIFKALAFAGATVLSVPLLLQSSGVVAAPLSTFTPVNTNIDNVGNVAYDNEFGVAQTPVDSNLSRVPVGGINALDLEDDRSVNANPGDSVTFAHRLTNVGNQDDSYTLSVAQTAGDDGEFTNIDVYLDSDGDGVFDLGEPLLTSSATLSQDEFIDIVVIATIDGSEDFGDTVSYTLTATSVNDGTTNDSNLDTVFIVGDAEINLNKSTTRQCTADTLTQVDGDYDYTIDFDNEGILTLNERSVSVDGVGTDGVLIEDTLDGRIELRTGQTITATPASAQFLVQRAADTGANLWITYGNWNGTDELASVGLIFDAADLGVGESGSVSFGVSIAGDVEPADDSSTPSGNIFNAASIDIDGDTTAEFSSNQVCNELDVLEPALDLRDDRADSALPGATVTFDHVLENTGELDDTYDISALDVTGTDDGDFDSISIFYVADGDGQFDDVLTTTPMLSPTDTLDIRVEVVLPGAAALGESYQFTLTADSNHGNFGVGLSDTNTDTVSVIQPAVLSLTKSNTRQCGVDVLTQVDGDYSYTMSVTNNGDLAPAERSISVDAVSVDKVLVEDALDSRIELLAGQTIIPSPAGAQFVVQRSADVVGDLWITYGAWNGTDELAAVGLLVDADDLEELESASATFGVRIASDVVPADDSSTASGNILNSLFVDLDGDNTAEFTSASVCNELDVLEPALDLRDDRAASALAGSTVLFDHILENTGELDDTYDITLAQVTGTDSGNFDSIAVFYVADGDGLFNDVLTTTPTLTPGDTLAIRIEAVVPAGASPADTYQLTIDAESNLGSFGTPLNDTNTDTLTVLEDVMIDITKGNSRQCGADTLTQVDGDFTYSLTVNNSGDVAPAERAFTVNGGSVNGVLIADTLDSRIDLISGQTLNPAPAQFLVQRTLDIGANLWITYATWNGADVISSIGLFADADDLEAGEGFNITFGVRIDPDVVPANDSSTAGNILNTASVDLDGDTTADFTSNQVCNELDVLEPNLDLTNNQSANVTAGQTIEFTHTLENTGELDDTYDITLQNTTGDDGDLTGLAVFYAADPDGILNDALTTTPTLIPGDTLQIRIEGTVPGSVTAGDSIQVELIATSNVDGTLSDTNTDTLTLIDSAIIDLTKSNSTACAVTLNQGASYDYTIDFENTGDLAPVERSFSINGTPTDGVLIQDELAVQLLLETGQTISPTPAAASFVVQRTSDVGGNLWITYASWNGTDALSSVGLLVDADDLQPGDTGTVTFSVQVDPNVAAANEGTINNQAFVDLDGDDTDNFESNTVCNTLDVLEPALDLTADKNVTSAANLEVQFDHLVENTGELTDTYTLSVVNLAGDDDDLNGLKLYHDLNNNDRFDTGEPEVNTTGALDPGDEFPIVIVGTVPPGVSVSDVIRIEVKAISTLEVTLDDTNTDTVTITNGAVIQLVKSTTDACPIELEAGDIYTYTVNFSNTGGSPPVERSISIDSISRDGVLIEDRLPTGTASLVTAPTPVFTPAAGRLVVQTSADALASVGLTTDLWTSYGAWNGTDPIEAIGLFLDNTDLEPAEAGTLSWQMQIDAGATAGTQIFNTAFVDLDNDDTADFSSNTVCNLVGTPDPGVDLRNDQSISAVAGATVEFTHTLENTGDDPDTYNVTVQNLAGDDGDLSGLSVFYAADADGILNDPLTVTPTLAVGATLQIRIEGILFGGPTAGDQIEVQITAVSQTDGTITDNNTDTVTVILPAIIDLDKTATRICTADTLTQVDGDFDYIISWENEGNLPPEERTLTVSGSTVNGVLIEDDFDNRLNIRAGQTILPTPATASVLVHETGAASDVWITYADWNTAGGVASVDAFGVFMPAADMSAGDTGTVTIGVSVRSDVLPADEGNILNVATINLDGAGAVDFTSEQTCNELDYVDPALDLRDDRNINALVNTTIEFLHELENTGVQSDTYNVVVTNLAGDNGELTALDVFYAADADGILDDPLTTTPTLAPGAVLNIRVEGFLGGSLVAGQQVQVSITATSNLVNTVTDTNTDTVTVIEDTLIELVKSSTRACAADTLTQIDGDFQYSISFENKGDLPPAERTVSIDGTNTDGVLISDSLDSRLQLLTGQTITSVPATASFIVHETAAAADVWRSYLSWDAAGGVDAIDAVGLLVDADDMEEDETGSFGFNVRINPAVVLANSGDIFNTAIIDVDGDTTAEFSSNQVCNRLNVLTPGLDLEASQTTNALAGETLEFLHTLTNTSALTDSYTITIGNSASGGLDYDSFAVFYDADTLDADTALDDPLTVTPNLAAGEVLNIRVEAVVPATAVAGNNYLLELTATSNLDPALSDTNTDGVTITVLPPAVINLTKSATRSCGIDTLTLVDSDYSYSISFTNNGGSSPVERAISVDAVNVDGVLIEDVLDSRLLLKTGQTITATPAGAQFIVQRSVDSVADLWIAYGAWNGTDNLSSVGLLVDEADLEVGEGGSFGFAVSIDPGTTNTSDILNTAFVDLDGDSNADYTSNQTCNQFNATTLGVSVEPDQSVIASPGDTLEFFHFVRNTGDVTDVYRITAGNILTDDGDFVSLEAFYDEDRDGQLDDPITNTPPLNPGQQIRVRVVAVVSDTQEQGTEVQVGLLALSESDRDIFDTAVDTVEIPPPADFSISKTSDASCDSPLEPGDSLSYSVSFSNSGGTPMPISYSISGREVEGIILEDRLPYSVQPTSSITASGTAVVKPFANGWIYLSDWNGTDLIQSVGSFMTVDTLSKGSSGSLNFGAFITETATNSSELVNTAFISSETSSGETQTFSSNSTCASVDAPAVEAQIRFLRPTDPIGITTGDSSPDFEIDEDFEDSEIYRINNGISNYNPIRDGVFIQVESTSISDETYTVLADGRRQVVVTINSNATGATTQMILQETFPGSGTYRAIRPLILSTTAGVAGVCGSDNPVPNYDAAPEPECVLNAVQGDTLTVSLFDDGVGEILDDAAIVDPLGVVFDSVTRTPVAGAQVYVCAVGADAPDDGIEGDRCGPDAELAIDPFRFIEDGVNEPLPIQTTGDDGFYQYAFLLEGTYFMGVDAPSGYAFASGREPNQFVDLIVEDIFDGIAIARFSQVFDASYGRDGYLAAVPDSGTFFLDELNPLIVIDLPIDPVEIALEVTSTCDVEVTTTDPVTYTLGYANVGNLTPTEKNISVDGSTDSGILFEDVLPFDVNLNSEQSGDPSPDGSIPLVQLFSDANTNNWLNLSSWDGVTPVARIGILVPGSAFGPGAEGGFTFDVTVSENLTDRTVLENVLGVDVDGDGLFDFSAQADCDAVGPSAEIRFVAPEFDLILNGEAPTFENDNDFIDTTIYRLEDNLLNYNPTRDGIYIELTSTSIPRSGFNVLSDGRRQIVVNVESALTGDTIIVVLHEVGFATGIYRSTRTLLLSGTQSGNGAQCPSDARAAPDYVNAPPAECVLQSASNDVLTVTFLDPRLGITLEDDALVDPLGVVFDSQTLTPVEGAEVQIYNADGTVAIDPFTLEPIPFQITGEDGFYQYPFLFPGTFYMDVVPPAGYSFPSAATPATLNGQLLQGDSDRAGTPLSVIDASYGQDGFSGIANSGQYTLDLANSLIVIDFPLDTGTDPLLTVEKSATREYVELGGLVEYKITVRNSGRASLTNVQLIDDLPFGFKYIKGTMHRAGELTSEPLGAPGPQLTIDLGSLQVGESIDFSYVLQATAGAVDGDGINEAQATARFGGNPIASNVARFQVELERDGVLSEKAVVFGKVYVDSDCNNIQSEGEWPIGGVKLYMENGTYVITDENGMYTLFGIRSGNHVLKIDPLTLPTGINLKPIDNRHGADPDSRFVDVRDGEYHRADFAASCPSAEQTDLIMDQLIERNESISGDWLLEDASRFNPTLNNNISDLALGQRNGGDLSSGILGNRLNQTDEKDLRNRLSVATAVDGSEIEDEPLEELIPDDFPVAEEVVKTVTKAQAKEGTWLWPKDDISRLGRFMVVVRDGAKASLFLNGQPVSDKQVGEHFVNKREKAQVIAWYGLKLDDGINTLEVKAKDSFGNERVLAEKQFQRPGGATSMEVIAESDTLPADGGRSKTPVTIRLLDDLGLPARGVYYATVEVSDGFWEEEDLQDKIEGYQVRIQDGEATLHLRSSEFTGDVRIRVTTGIYEEETTVTFIQSQRGLFATGILDAGTELCTKSGSGRDPSDDFCKTADINTRAAFFLKGQVKGGYFLTMSYDSEKLGDEELLRDLNPNEFYPIMGDSSVRGYEAQSRSKLYAKIEYDRNSIAWGDFVTDVNTGHRDLGRVQRTLSGVQAIYDEGKVKAEVFGALVDDPRGSVEFAGNGTAMLYRIEQAPIVRNSEVVELIIRDRDARGLVIESRNLQRLADYTIDYLSGDVRFVESIPTFDENLNPVFVRISYDLKGDGNEELVAGVRGSYELVENLVVAGSYTTDENELNGYEILGTYLEYAPTDDMTIVVSAANMDHNELAKSDGYALYSSIEMEWKGGSRSSATWGRAEQGFQNSSPVSADRQELKINHSQKLGKKLSLDAEVLSSETMSTGNTNDSVRISGDYDVAGWTLTMGGRRIEQESENSDEQGNPVRSKDTATTIIAGAGRSFEIFGQSLNLNAEYERETGGQNRERWLVNSTTSLTDKINLYGTFEQINSLSGINGLDSGTDRINASFGFETNWLPSTSVYNEYRMRGVTDGRDLEAATGVRGDYTIMEGIQVSPSVELINTLEGQQNADSVAVSVGIQESLNENRRSSVRLETRFTDDRDYYGMDLSYVSRLNLDWSAFVREDFRYTDNATGSEDLQHILTLGLTHRPRETNDYHMISMYQWKEDRAEGLLGDRSAHLLSVHQNYQYSEDLTISSRVGAKYEVFPLLDRNFSSLTAVMDGRLIWDLTRRIDLDVHAGIIGTNEFDEIRYSAGLGLNYLVNKNLRVGVGYNLIGFDEGDLDPEGFNRHGIYLNAQYKFDEDLFFWLENDANSNATKTKGSTSQEAAK